jgi:glycolate oxidase iron-sulfur subunit
MSSAKGAREAAKDCVHCGFCLPACPTYQLWGEETDSPRGRIHLISQVLEGAPLTDAARTHFDRCLGCMACMTACPSGVQYDVLIEAARQWSEDPSSLPGTQAAATDGDPGMLDAASGPEGPGSIKGPGSTTGHETGMAPASPHAPGRPSTHGTATQDDSGAPDGKPGPAGSPGAPISGGIPARPRVPKHESGTTGAGVVASAGRRPARERATRAAIFATFPYPRRLRVASGPLRIAQRTGLDRWLARTGLVARVSATADAALRLAPPAAAGPAGRLPERVPARGARRAVAGMLTGCVQSVFFPSVNAATARVLAAEGCDVVIPRDQGCCGALSLHSGRAREAARFARGVIAAFERAGVDVIVVNSAGCGSAMKEYERLLAGDPGWARRAAALSAKVRDLAEFLAELGPVAERRPLAVTAAYHDACHLGHAQRITRQPRDLLSAIPSLQLVEVPDAGTCCGSAGVYNLLQPQAARALGERKADSVLATGASVLVSANPGCTLQISALLAERGQHITTAHTAEVLDASIRGLPLRGGQPRGRAG